MNLRVTVQRVSPGVTENRPQLMSPGHQGGSSARFPPIVREGRHPLLGHKDLFPSTVHVFGLGFKGVTNSVDSATVCKPECGLTWLQSYWANRSSNNSILNGFKVSLFMRDVYVFLMSRGSMNSVKWL